MPTTLSQPHTCKRRTICSDCRRTIDVGQRMIVRTVTIRFAGGAEIAEGMGVDHLHYDCSDAFTPSEHAHSA